MPKKAPKVPYENNPFFIAINGMTLLFNAARGMAMILFVLSLANFYRSDWKVTSEPGKSVTDTFTAAVSGWTTMDWSLAVGSVLIIGLAVAMISALFGGAFSYTSAQIALGKNVTIREAFRESFEHLWSYLWLQVIINVKLFLWSLLLIVPGFYMNYRYSLAGVAFFDNRKNLRGNAAIKESLRLTKGAWITTFAAHTLFNLITFNVVSDIVDTGVNALLYRQFDASDKKPKAHWLSVVTLVTIIFLVVLALFLITILSNALINYLFS